MAGIRVSTSGGNYIMRLTTQILPLAICLVFFAGAVPAENATDDRPKAVTTDDPDVPLDELELMLRPLTREELLVEAEAWRALLKAKAEQIARAEIAVKRQNREIEKTEEIQEQAEEAKDQLEEVKEKVEEARREGNADKVREAEEAARDAQATLDEMGETVDEAAAAAAQAEEASREISNDAREELHQTREAAERAQEALDQVQELVGERADEAEDASARELAADVRSATAKAKKAAQDARESAASVLEQSEAGTEKAEVLDQVASALEESQQAKEDQKVRLLEDVTALREQRIVLIDRLKTVLEELESKTDKEDTDTLATINDYRLYINSLRGIQLDVKDTTSAWISVTGWLTSKEGGLRLAGNIGLFLGILVAAWVLSRLLSRVVRRGLQLAGNVSALLEDFLVKSVRWVVMIVGVIMALAALEVSIGPLLAVVGAAGFVVAFALQDSLGNFASGLMILAFRPFDVGDVVEAAGVAGKVTTMNLVSTTIKTFDNKDMIVPNSKIWNDVITNATGVANRRVDMEFGIGYGDDIDRAQEILEQIVAEHPLVLDDPEPTIRMHTLADSSVNFICRPWARTADYWNVYWDVTKAVKQRFDEAGIGIPFPQRDVHLYFENTPAQDTIGKLSGNSGTPVGG
jgi:small conductance mechanosensitive channel